ncbi:30S ribosomal protein S8 [Candidatus Woesearchaeota archaeon]|nr:MAG: 30S ribosomal protein S8 [Candidatus Woesearchaeota archaeon]
MSLNDPLANVLSHMKNYEQTKKKEVVTRFNSKLIRGVLEILQKEGYVGSVETVEDARGGVLKINLLGRINDVNVIKPNFQIGKSEFEKYEKRFLPAKGFGILVVSTSKGLMTHEEAKKQGVGGKLLAYCY